MERVRVYYNLRKHVFSVIAKRRDDHGRLVWKLIDHTEEIGLRDVKFIVSEIGRQRVLRTGMKNVHAYVEGVCIPLEDVKEKVSRRAYYNPYKTGGFVVNNALLLHSEYALLVNKEVYVNA